MRCKFKKSKKEKALDIIKENLININESKYYGTIGIFINAKNLTQEEYELLKEVLR